MKVTIDIECPLCSEDQEFVADLTPPSTEVFDPILIRCPSCHGSFAVEVSTVKVEVTISKISFEKVATEEATEA